MTAYLYRMPSGIQGDISRRAQSRVESASLNVSLPFPTYGVPGKIVSNKFIPLVANDVASAIWGLFARPYPITGANGNDPLGTSTPQATGPADVMRSGWMTVVNNAGTPAKGGQVYVRVANPSSASVIGGIEASASFATPVGTAGSNTGNGTIGSITSAAPAITGTYRITMTAATAFTVDDPNGFKLKNGATGVAYTAEGLTFTITAGGTPFIAGDTFTVAVVQNTVAIPNAFFESAADASGNVEIAFNI